MLRAFSLSLAAHALLIASLLLFATTRTAVRVAELPRSVRLVARLEPAPPPAAPARAPHAEAPAPARAPVAVPAAPPVRTARPKAREAPEVTAAPRPVAVPKILVPAREKAPAPAAPPRPEAAAFRDRLEQRLAAVPRVDARARETAQPRVASLPAAQPSEPPRPAALGAPPSHAVAAPLPAGPVVPLADFPFAWYVAVVQERVFGRWTPPSEFYLGGRNVAALVAFRIDRAGRTSRIALREGSGYGRFDRSALVAVEGLRDLPPLPDGYREDSLDVVIRFQSRNDGR